MPRPSSRPESANRASLLTQEHLNVSLFFGEPAPGCDPLRGKALVRRLQPGRAPLSPKRLLAIHQRRYEAITGRLIQESKSPEPTAIGDRRLLRLR
jgi:hypothetical protein